MKWIALAAALLAILPFATWLRRNPRETPKVWILMGFLPFGVGAFHLYMAVISWQFWPGYVKGAEISVLDLLALALYFSLPRKTCGLPFKPSMGLYFLAVLLSVFQSDVPMAALFYVWQISRMFLVYAVVVKSSEDDRVVPALLVGMTIGLVFEVCDAMWERLGLGILQTGGTLGHQNFLGLMSHFATFPSLALLLAGESGWVPIVAPIAGVVLAVLTVSRGTIGLMGVGYLGLFSLSALRRWTSRKGLILAAGLAVICLASPFAISSFDARFSKEIVTEYDERGAFENAATMIILDHPFGIGPNNYVVISNIGGYNAKAGVAPQANSDSANVHNIYYLVAAESGYLGLCTFVILLIRPMFVAFRCSWQHRRDRRGDLLLGLGMSLLIVYIHSYFEWIFITFPGQYMFALDAGMVAGLAIKLGYWQRSRSSDGENSENRISRATKSARN